MGKKIGLGIVFLYFMWGGIMHFANPEMFVRIMPPYLPLHYEAVYISGVFELIGAIGILIPTLRQMAGNGLFLLTIIVTPANFYMWQHPEKFPEMPPALLTFRLVMQVVLLLLIWWSTRNPRQQEQVSLAKIN